MIDPELKEHLEKIEVELVQMRKRTVGIPHALSRGAVYGAGYILGTVLIIVMVGWILNIVGVIPAFSREVGEFRTALENVGRR
jgi:uncharacterized oligopeptide transporter (OPT) family protein